MSTESLAESARYEPGDVVQVRSEELWSVVVLPTHRGSDMPKDTTDLGAACCVPVALVRTPLATDNVGPMRWVEISDLTSVMKSADEDSPVPP